MCIVNIFSLLCLIAYLFKFSPFLPQKWNFSQKNFLGCFYQNFQKMKLINKVRKHSLNTGIKMVLANFWWFLSKNHFLPLFKNFGPKNEFKQFLKKAAFSQKSDMTISTDSLWNLLSKNVIFTLVFVVTWKLIRSILHF